MTTDELILECKLGLGFSLDNRAIDGIIRPKVLTVKGYMIGAGMPETKLTDAVNSDDLAVGTLVLGVTDLWELNSGQARYSEAFMTMLTQLCCSDVIGT
jgi:hypothetical protein